MLLQNQHNAELMFRKSHKGGATIPQDSYPFHNSHPSTAIADPDRRMVLQSPIIWVPGVLEGTADLRYVSLLHSEFQTRKFND
ncbi:unnamed protein product [Nezara viridula]|uniref:Uncharacterized protein n=1 Tax=Nezara viridula TaxID=85310 RepID=A0A9P0GZM1_NEZVI|nr:unnamed protein product [Nezara viridula]